MPDPRGVEPDPTSHPEPETDLPAQDVARTDDAAATALDEGDASAAPEPLAADQPKAPRVVLCPYCGHTQTGDQGGRCAQCGGLFEPLSRRATQIAMGPWTIRDKANPFRPGFSYEVLKKMIASGRVTPTTVLRGPTTRQFWSIARNVPGVAHLLGFCHKCGKHVEKDIKQCPHCAALFKSVKTRNELGLLFPNRKAAEAAQRSLNRTLGIGPPADDERGGAVASGAGGSQAGAVVGAGVVDDETISSGTSAAGTDYDTDDAMSDLLDDVLGSGVAQPSVVPGRPVEPLDFTPSDNALLDELAEAASRTTATVASRQPAGSGTPRHPIAEAATVEGGPPESHPAALPPRSGISPLIWGLIAMNVLVAGVIAYFVLSQASGG